MRSPQPTHACMHACGPACLPSQVQQKKDRLALEKRFNVIMERHRQRIYVSNEAAEGGVREAAGRGRWFRSCMGTGLHDSFRRQRVSLPQQTAPPVLTPLLRSSWRRRSVSCCGCLPASWTSGRPAGTAPRSRCRRTGGDWCSGASGRSARRRGSGGMRCGGVGLPASHVGPSDEVRSADDGLAPSSAARASFLVT